MTTVHAHILLGGIGDPILGWPGGWDGKVTSEGLITLAHELEQLPGVDVTIRVWGDYGQLLPLLGATPEADKTAVIGYSGGGSRATWLANTATPAGAWPRIDLMVCYDPSPSWQMTPLHANVGKAICYRSTMPLMLGLGGGRVTAAPHWGCKTILTREITEQHLEVQFNSHLHAATVQAVKDLQ